MLENLSRQVDLWLQGKIRSDEHFNFGNTPEVLKQLGAQNLPIVTNQSVMVKITGGSHAIALDVIKDIPAAMAVPIMIFKSDTVKNAFVILTEHNDKSGDAVIVALHLNKEEKYIRVNRVASIYGKERNENFIQNQIAAGNLKYVNKNKSQAWSQSRGLQLPKLADTNPDNNIILYKENVVNRYAIKKSGKYAPNKEKDENIQYAIAKDPGERKTDELPKKAQTALRQTESRLSERIGEILGVPKRAQRDFLQGIIRGISEDYLQSGVVDRAKADTLFEEAHKQGALVNAEYITPVNKKQELTVVGYLAFFIFI